MSLAHNTNKESIKEVEWSKSNKKWVERAIYELRVIKQAFGHGRTRFFRALGNGKTSSLHYQIEWNETDDVSFDRRETPFLALLLLLLLLLLQKAG
jgi:hypothetical protein